MGEIITVQLGQCGNQIGTRFWENICQQHGLESSGFYCGGYETQLEKIGVYFHELRSARYIPRSVLVDLEPEPLDTIQRGSIGKMISPTNFLRGQNGGGGNWARGFHSDGEELSPTILNVIRREAERADSLQGFHLVHGVSSCTGGGLGSLLLSRLYDEYPHRQHTSFSVFPSDVSGLVVSPYNVVLSMRYLLEHCDATVCMDNGTATTITELQTYVDTNRLLASTIAGLTLSFRFPSQINSDLRKLVGNMVPFYRLHFFQTGFASVAPRNVQQPSPYNSETILQRENRLLRNYGVEDKFLSMAAIFQGDVSAAEAEDMVQEAKNQHSDRFVEWIPDNAQAVSCQSIPAPRSVTFLTHSVSIRGMMRHFLDRHNTLYRRRAFTMWYCSEGMDEMEFEESAECLEDLIVEYTDVVDTASLEAV
ncbi:beta-tubulin 1 tubb1 [Flagelloscypha sp. PMI_526]|nr:beta-tubulin 1 tubb1 [Flagelloscypha sp. PMI_526]